MTLWERTQHAFERMLEESQRASTRLAETLGEAGEAARHRLERARLERTLFKRFARLGSRVYERIESGVQEKILEDAEIQGLVGEIRQIDTELKKRSAESS